MRLPLSLALFGLSAVVVASPLGPFGNRSEAIKSSVVVSSFTSKARNLALFAAASPQSALDLVPVASDSAFATTPTSSPEISITPALSSSFISLVVSPVNTSTLAFSLTSSSSSSVSSTAYNILSGANVVVPVTLDSVTTTAASAISLAKPLASHLRSSVASVVSLTSHKASSSVPSSSTLSKSISANLLSKSPHTPRLSSLLISHSASLTTARGTFLSSSSSSSYHLTASSSGRLTPTGKAESALPTAVREPPVTPATSLAASAYSANLARAKSYNSLYANLTFESRCMPKQIACISGNVVECDATTSTFALLQVCLPTSESSCFAMPDPTKSGVDVGCVNIKSAQLVLGDVSPFLPSKAPTATSSVAMPSSTVDITVTQIVPQTHTLYVTATTVEATSTETPLPTKPKHTPLTPSESHHFTPTHTLTVFVTVTRSSGTEESQSPAMFSVPSTVDVIPVTLAPSAPTTSPSKGNEDYNADGDRNGNELTVGVPATVTVVKTVSVFDTTTLISITTATTTATRTTTEASTTYTQMINVIS